MSLSVPLLDRCSTLLACTVVFASMTMLVSAGSASADLIVHEEFSYTAGSQLNGQSGGIGFGSAWRAGAFNAGITNHLAIQSSSLVGNLLPSVGGSVSSTPQLALAGLVRDLANPLGRTNSTVYLSFLARAESEYATGLFNNFFGITLETSGDELFIGRPGATNQWSLETRGGGGLAASGRTPVLNQTSLLIVKAEFRTGLDRFTLFVDPRDLGTEPLTGAVKDDIDLQSVTGIGIYSTGGFSLDEIRIGTTYQSVVPEPGTLSLGLMAAAALCMARRKR